MGHVPLCEKKRRGNSILKPNMGFLSASSQFLRDWELSLLVLLFLSLCLAGCSE